MLSDLEFCENRFGFEPEITAKVAEARTELRSRYFLLRADLRRRKEDHMEEVVFERSMSSLSITFLPGRAVVEDMVARGNQD